MSIKAKAMRNLYNKGRITVEGLRKAVEDGVITAEEFAQITGETYQ